MLRPVKMSLLSLYIKKECLPNLLSDLIQIKYFHTKNPIDSSITRESEESPRKSFTIFSEEDYKKRLEKITLVQTYLDDIFGQIGVASENIKPPKKENRIDFNYISLDEILNDLQARVDFNYRRLENMAKELESVDEHLENLAETASLLNIIAKFGGESYTDADFKRLQFELYTASSNQYKMLSDSIQQLNSPIVIYGEPISEQMVGFFVFYETEYYKLFHDLFLSYNCHKVQISKKYIDEEGIHMEQVQEDHDSELIKRNHFYSLYQEQLNTLPQTIMAYYETLENIRQLIEIEKEIQQTPSHNTYKIEGFVPSSIEKRVVAALENQFGNNIKIESRKIQRMDPYLEHHGKVEEPEHETVVPPSLLNLNPLLKPYQNLIKLYGITNYSEVDPSIVLLFTFPIIFGLMFGDVGHGLCLMVFGMLGALIMRKNKGKSAFLWLIFYCGIGAVFGGLVYGESFGADIEITSLENIIPLYVRIMDEGGVMAIVKMSIIVGVVTLSLGFFIRGMNYAINKKKYLAFSECLFKILILIGGTIVIFKYGFDINAWFSPPYPILLVIIPSLLFIIIQVLGKTFGLASYLKKKSYGDIVGHASMDLGETMLSIISNVASFIRILALEMAHVGLMLVVSEISYAVSGPGILRRIIEIIVIIFGNTFVIVLETTIVMIHTLRLHFYEFFSKFFVADGYEFKVIEIEETYSNLQFAIPSEVQTPFLYRRKR
ncbi:MAG: hypothetical protein JW776_05205 [Candidatus Lokiarchaeota archaeon]|nr:hypothetical protein [Candidatus Lokiarchaeota archaeon]